MTSVDDKLAGLGLTY